MAVIVACLSLGYCAICCLAGRCKQRDFCVVGGRRIEPAHHWRLVEPNALPGARRFWFFNRWAPAAHVEQLSADNTAVEMAGKVSSKVHAVLDGKASWVPLLACVVFAALKAADGDPAALLHSCEVCFQLQFCVLWCAFSCLIAPAGYVLYVSCTSA